MEITAAAIVISTLIFIRWADKKLDEIVTQLKWITCSIRDSYIEATPSVSPSPEPPDERSIKHLYNMEPFE